MSREKTSWEDIHSGRMRNRADGIRSQHESNRALAESTGSRAVIHQSVPDIGTAGLEAAGVELDQSATEEQPRQHIGFATEPGYDDKYDAWGGRHIDENPRHF